jgi:hypothetical protein
MIGRTGMRLPVAWWIALAISPNACDSNLAHALDAERVDLLVPLIDDDYVVRGR